MWVRLSVWGFRFASISINIAGRAVQAAGGVKYDEDKAGREAFYVLFRHELPSGSKAQAPPPAALREENWTRTLRREELNLSITVSRCCMPPVRPSCWNAPKSSSSPVSLTRSPRRPRPRKISLFCCPDGDSPS
eukprot:70063-Hanusia_phi.AAC.1